MKVSLWQGYAAAPSPRHSRMKIHAKLLILLVVALCFAEPATAGGLRPAHARRAMVVSANVLASDAGVTMMKLGGNAVDAAVSTSFALAVVHPQAGNLG